MRLFRPSIIALNALIFGTFLAASPSMAQAQLTLLINQGQAQGKFLIDGDVTYATGMGVVSMDVSLSNEGSGGQNPLMCFDFSGEAPAVKLRISSDSSSATGGSRLLVNELGLTSALQYQLSAKTISITPSSDVACFFKAYDTTTSTLTKDFGLYGQPPTSASATPSVVFQDNFVANPKLDLSVTTPSSPDSNGAVTYTITATNNSAFSVGSLALQQSIPLGLDATVTRCQVNGQDSSAICDTAKQDTLRYVGFTLASGESLELGVTVSRNASWPSTASSLPIFAAIATPTLTGIVYDVYETTVAPIVSSQ